MHTTRSSPGSWSLGSLLVAGALVAGCAVGTGAPDQATAVPSRLPASLDPASSLTSTLAVLPNLPVRPSAEPEAFAAGLERAAAGELAFAIPAFEVSDGTALYLTVRTLVGLLSGVHADHLLADDTSCDRNDPTNCSLQFERLVASFDGTLNTALAPYARLVGEATTDLQVVSWIPVRNGIEQAPVVTIQGIRNGRILGIAVFREAPPAPAPAPAP